MMRNTKARATRSRLPALRNPQPIECAQYIYRQLGCYGIIRIDYILSGERGQEQINLLEINTTPGMTPASFIPQQVRASEFEIADVLSEIIEGRF